MLRMKLGIRRRRALLAAAIASVIPAFANAQTTIWIDGSSNWSANGNWNNGVPGGNSDARIAETDGVNRVITYDYTGSPITLNSLIVDLTGQSSIQASTLAIPADNLTVNNEYVGDSGTVQVSRFEIPGSDGSGSIQQSGGINTVNNSLYMGYNPIGDLGVYSLSGGSLQGLGYQYIGYSGTALFQQTGGINNWGFASGGTYIGYAAGAAGTYILSAGTLDGGPFETIGQSGSGAISQSGGVNSVQGSLFMAFGSAGTGAFTLSGTAALSTTANEYVGYAGSASFNQTGGTNAVGNNLYLGYSAGSTGTYVLGNSGSKLEALNGGVFVGGTDNSAGGVGQFTVNTGGTAFILGMLTAYNTPGTVINLHGGTIFTGTLNFNNNPNQFNWTSGTLSLDNESLYVDSTSILENFGSSASLQNGQVLFVSGSENVGYTGSGFFLQSGGSNTPDSGLHLGVFTGSTGTYILSNTGTLNSVTSSGFIGDGGAGIFSQLAGTHTINPGNVAGSYNLTIGNAAGSNGAYSISGGSFTDYGIVYVGYSGTGAFNQSGGTTTIGGSGYLVVANTGTGTFSLSSSGSLSAPAEFIGVYGNGSFNQSGGTNTLGSAISDALYVASGSGSIGNYSLSGAASLSAATEYIGYFGNGAFTQSISTNNISFVSGNSASGNLYVGYGSAGTYNLGFFGGLSADVEFIGYNGNGTFNQAGGTNSVNLDGANNASGSIYVGFNSGGTGAYILTSGTLTAQTEYVGDSGVGQFNQSGGNNAVAGSLFVAFSAGVTATYSLSGASQLSAATEDIGASGNGAVSQTGGLNLLTGALNIGVNAGSIGNYTLNGNATLSAPTETVGVSGNGTFTQSEGVNTITFLPSNISSGNLYLGYAGGTGTFVLSGLSSLEADDEYVGYSGLGTFNQSSGGNFVTNDANNNHSGSLFVGFNAGSAGTYLLSGQGSLSSLNEYVGYGGNGTFNQSGGINTVAGTLYIGVGSGVTGSYTFSGSGGTLNATGSSTASVTIGGLFGPTGASGKLNVPAGGDVNINGALTVFDAPGCAVNLTGGVISTGSFNFNNDFNRFNWTSGTLAITTSTLITDNTGDQNYGSTATLQSGQTLVLSAGQIIGANGTGTFIQNGGSIIADGLAIYPSLGGIMLLGNAIGSTGSYTLNGGIVNVTIESIGGDDVAAIYDNNSYLTPSPGGTGTFIQTGGQNNPTFLAMGGGGVYPGIFGTYGSGSYILQGGTLASSLESLGTQGPGSFIQSGGFNYVGELNIAAGQIDFPFSQFIVTPGMGGTYNLSNGTLSAGYESVGRVGEGAFNQTGGANNIGTGGELDIAAYPGSSGSYDLSGGNLFVDGTAYVGGGRVLQDPSYVYGPGGTGFLVVGNTGQLTITGVLYVFSAGYVSLSGKPASVGYLSLSGNAIVNLNTTLQINYGTPANDPIATIVSYLKSGYSNGTWSGTSGIISTAISSGPASPTLSLGYADGNIDTGTAAALDQIVVKYTLLGDANLDGLVNFQDLVTVVQNFNKAGTDWAHGDFHYGSSTNFVDLVAVVQNFNKILTPAGSSGDQLGKTPSQIQALDVQFPEPTVTGLLIFSVALLKRRRNR